MQVTVEGQQMDVGDALRTHVKDKLEDISSKYFGRTTVASVKFTPESHAFVKVSIFIRVGKDIEVMAEDVETDPYAAFDIAAARIAKQLRRYKRKLRDHHERENNSPQAEAIKARDYILAQQELEGDNGEPEKTKQEADFEEAGVPPVIAEVATEIKTLTVSDAVMRMDLAHENAMLFRNSKTKRLNLVYRRADGNIGWIDPEMVEADAEDKPKLKSV